MAEYKTMPGAGEDKGSNPPVSSKFDRSGGKGLRPPHLTHPGAVAPVTGTKVAGHTENGHRLPTEAAMHKGSHSAHFHAPASLGSNMANGQKNFHAPNSAQTDDVSKK